MADLATKIELYCIANGKIANFNTNGNVSLQDDGSGAYIKSWSVDGLHWLHLWCSY